MSSRSACIVLTVACGLLFPAARAQAQPPVRLRNRTFVAPANVRLADSMRPSARSSGVRHFLVQFASPVDAATLSAIRRAGAIPLRYVPDNALAIAAPGALTAGSIPGARWVGQLQPTDRISEETARDLAAPFPAHPLTVVEFHPDVPRPLVEQSLLDAGAATVPIAAGLAHIAVITTSGPAVRQLAGLDAVAWIYPAAQDLEWRPAAMCDGLVRPEGILANYAAMGEGWDGPGLGSVQLAYFLQNASADLRRSVQLEELRRAMAEWSRQVAVSWTRAARPTDPASVNILWGPVDHGDGFPFEPGVLAHAFYPAPPVSEPFAGDVHFNDTLDWGVNDPSRWDVFSVALHELGHSLGLVHSADPSSVMYPIYRGLVTGLSPLDVAAARTIYAPAAPENLPGGWSASAVGDDESAQATIADTRFTLTSAGQDIWESADEFSFLSRTLRGDGDIVARVDALDGTNRWAKAGVMMRGSEDASSLHAFALVSLAKGLAFQRRVADGAESVHTDGGPGSAPRWLWLSRRGSRVEAHAAADGGEWMPIGSDVIPFAEELRVGLAVTAHQRSGRATAVFSSVIVTRLVDGPWSSADVGVVGRKGNASFEDPRVVVRGAGADVWDRADAFHFVWRRVSGDVDIVARLSALQGIRPWTKAGVMIRGAIDPGARHAFLLGSSGKGFAFQRRREENAWSVHDAAGPSALGRWLKLSRRGQTITAYRSTDGIHWIQVGEDTIGFGGDALIGLAVSSHTTVAPAEAVFDSVEITSFVY